MRSRFLTPANTYDRAAIMRSAWARARHAVASAAEAPAPYRATLDLRTEFRRELRVVWSEARQSHGYVDWLAEQQAGAAAEAARRAALTPAARAIENAEYAVMLAEHDDTDVSGRLVRDAYARLAALQHAA